MASTLYRCKTPTNYLCPCGRVARRLDNTGIDYEQVRVKVLKRDRGEIEELTGQRWVPVLVHGDELIHDSKRIIEFIGELRRSAAEAEGVR